MKIHLAVFALLSLLLVSCKSDEAMATEPGASNFVVTLGDRPLTVSCGGALSDIAKMYERVSQRESSVLTVEAVRDLGTVSKGFIRLRHEFDDLVLLLSIPHNKYPVDDLLVMVVGKGGERKEAYFETAVNIGEFEEFVELYKRVDFGQLCTKKLAESN